jgi:hypothetical protein
LAVLPQHCDYHKLRRMDGKTYHMWVELDGGFGNPVSGNRSVRVVGCPCTADTAVSATEAKLAWFIANLGACFAASMAGL